jgi:outer membrane protein
MTTRLLGLMMLAVGLCLVPATALAQQQIGYVDSQYILEQTPEYATVQQNLDRMAQEWQREVEQQQREVDEMFREYQARELLYTQEERQQKREAIMQAEQQVEQLRMRYFGPEGELFQQQEQLLRPIQEKVLVAVEEVALNEGYDYVLDKSGGVVFLYAPEEHDLSNLVLEELGIDIEQEDGGSSR